MSKLFLRSLYLMLLMLCLPSMASAETVAKIGATEYESLAAAVTAANAGETVSIVTAGTYTVPGTSKNITIQGVDGVVFNHTTAGNIAAIPNGATFKNVTFIFGNVNYHGFQHAGTINMEGCTLNGKLFSYGDMNFTNCQFVQDNSDYHMWVYGKGTVTYTNCTFTNNVIGKFLHLYTESSDNVGNVVVKNCKFINNGEESKAAINVKATSGSTALVYTLSVDNECTVEGAFPTAGVKDNSNHTDVISALVQVDDRKVAASAEHITVEVDNVPVYQAGAETEVVEINSVADLKTFRDAVNSGTSYAGKIVRLMADLDLSSETNWKPIGDVAAYPGHSLQGTFDGNGHSISNLTIDDQTVNWGCAALFGSVSNGSIVNLTVKNVDIKSHHYAAGIVAYKGDNTDVSITNCHVIGGTIITTPELLSSGEYDNGDKAGGIMGYCTAGTTIKDCTVESVTITAYRDLAGICGFAGGSVEECAVKDVTVVQDNTNAYKTENVAYTACEVVGGRSANAAATNAANTTENVTVKSVDPVAGVAKIGSTEYETLEAAVAAAQDGETVTLLADCAGNGIKVAQGKFATGLTVDFDGFTYTVDGETVGSTGTETNGFQLLKDNNITFKNGTITSEKAKILVQNYSNLTLEGMTLTLNNANYTSAYTLSNNNGEVVIDSTTINANPAGGFAFDVCRYASYPSVYVTVKDSSVINGNVEISASGSDAKDGFGLTLTSGTMTGDIVVAASAATAMEATPEKATVTKDDDFTQAAPAGFEWVSNNDGTSTLTELPSVAKIGDVEYKSLAAAVAAVPDNTPTTITVIADQTINVDGYAITIPATKNVVLDLNGKSVTGNTDSETTYALITNKGTLTIQDATGTGKLEVYPTKPWVYSEANPGGYASNLIRNEGTLTVENGNLYNDGKGSACYAIDNYTGGNVTINGGTVDAAKASAIRLFYNNGGSITVTDGVIGHYNSDDDCSYMGIQVQNGTNASVSVSGGTIAGNYALYANNTGGQIAISGGTFDGYVGFGSAGPSDISISGGTFYEWVGTWGDQTGFISGGNFATDPTEYCAAGYIGKANGDNTYSVVTGAYVAQIGTTKYETLEEAIAAAQDGETVTLLADVTLTDRLFVNAGASPAYASNNRYATTTENKSITLELDGHNITSSSNIALAGGSLNITNTGTADATHGVISTSEAGLAPVEIRGTGDLTAKRTLTVGTGVTLTGSTYGINVFGSNNSDKNIIDVNVNGTVNGTLFVLGNLKNAENEININVNGTIYVPNNDNNSAEVGIALNGNATVTVNEGANVSGETGIEVRAGELIVNGGTITATASTYSEKKNPSGSCTRGAAIAVVQHTTKLPIATTLSGGTLNGVEKLVIADVEEIGLNDVAVTATTSYTQQAEIPEGYEWNDNGDGTSTLVEATDIELANNGDNSAVITAANGKVRNVTLKGRTLYKDNCWNTICLPFDVTIDAESPLAGATVKELDAANSGYVAATKVLRINFKDAETDNDGNVVLKANTPYLLKWTSGNNVVAPVFNGVTVESGEAKAVSSDSEIEFIGTASTVTLEGTAYAYFGNNNKLLYVDAPTGKKIYTCRAYFYLPNQDFKAVLDAEANGAKSFVLSFGDDDDDITRVAAVAGQQKAEDDVYYDLQGRKIVGQPTVSGIYVKNGVKVYVK